MKWHGVVIQWGHAGSCSSWVMSMRPAGQFWPGFDQIAGDVDRWWPDFGHLWLDFGQLFSDSINSAAKLVELGSILGSSWPELGGSGRNLANFHRRPSTCPN